MNEPYLTATTEPLGGRKVELFSLIVNMSRGVVRNLQCPDGKMCIDRPETFL